MSNSKNTYYENLSGDVKHRYDEKIRNCGGIDPYTIKENDLSVDPNDFPEITLLDIGDYFVNSTSSYTKKKFSAYKATEGYAYFESGFVLSMGSKKNGDSAILRGKVKHSQRMNESPLKVWILAYMNGKIRCAHCTCIAGLSESCSHVGAICYALSGVWESCETKSVTDFLCKWNVPKFKDEAMNFAKNIHWNSRSLERPHQPIESSFLTYCNSLTFFPDEAIDQFIADCYSDGNETALGTMEFSSEIRRNTNLKDEVFLATLFCESNQNKTLCELIEIGKSISLEISNDDVREIFRLTIPKLKSKCRLALRRGRITGSNFRDCCIANIYDPSITTINRIINPAKFYGFTPRNQYKNKKRAVEEYFRTAASQHEHFEYMECGLIINPQIPYFAASPDGLVSCDCHGEGCVEIKCLKILESATSFEVLTRKPYNILIKAGNEYVLEKNHEYFYQLQLHMNLLELKYCDLTFWSPTPTSPPLIVRVNVDNDFWTISVQKAHKFHEQVIMPELLGKFYTRTDLPISMEEEVEEENYELFELEIELLNSIQE